MGEKRNVVALWALAGIVFVPYVPKGNKANRRNIWCELGKKRTVFI